MSLAIRLLRHIRAPRCVCTGVYDMFVRKTRKRLFEATVIRSLAICVIVYPARSFLGFNTIMIDAEKQWSISNKTKERTSMLEFALVLILLNDVAW